MRNVLIVALGVFVLAAGGYAAASGLDDVEPARTVSLPAATTGDTTTGETTTGRTTTGETTTGATTTNEVDDVSGPCDEAEHANDPRCTGGADADDDDNSGPGGGDDDRDDDDHDDDDDDRSGSNSGRG